MSWFTIGAAALGLLGASQKNKANATINDANIAFQKEAAQNAHQWEVEDLRKAGLNPILSAGGSGAKVGSVSMIPAENEIEAGVNSAISANASRDAHKQNEEILKGLQETTREKKANADSAEINARNLDLLSNYPTAVYDNNAQPVVRYDDDGNVHFDMPDYTITNRNLIAENMALGISNNAIQNQILAEDLKRKQYQNVYNFLEARAYSSPFGPYLYGMDKAMNYIGQGAQAFYNIKSGFKPAPVNTTYHYENGTKRYTDIYNGKDW